MKSSIVEIPGVMDLTKRPNCTMAYYQRRNRTVCEINSQRACHLLRNEDNRCNRELLESGEIYCTAVRERLNRTWKKMHNTGACCVRDRRRRPEVVNDIQT